MRYQSKFTILLFIILCSPTVFSKQQKLKSIYGEDNRIDMFLVENQKIQKQSRAVGGFIHQSLLKPTAHKGLLEVSTVRLHETGICKEERFSHQHSAAICTGFLIAPDLVMTAGHCATKKACKEHVWAFNLRYRNHDEEESLYVPEKHVATCEKVLYRIHKSIFRGGNDIGLIKLSKKIPIQPLRLNLKNKLMKNTPLYMLGHPSGLPLKYTDDGRSFKLKKWYFRHNLDSFAGNSGSPIFNAWTGLVEGVLSRGKKDYIFPEGRKCEVSKKYLQEKNFLDLTTEHGSYVRNISKTLRKYKVPAF